MGGGGGQRRASLLISTGEGEREGESEFSLITALILHTGYVRRTQFFSLAIRELCWARRYTRRRQDLPLCLSFAHETLRKNPTCGETAPTHRVASPENELCLFWELVSSAETKETDGNVQEALCGLKCSVTRTHTGVNDGCFFKFLRSSYIDTFNKAYLNWNGDKNQKCDEE